MKLLRMIVGVPVLVLFVWILDPWTGWFVTGDSLTDYVYGRAVEAVLVLILVAVVLLIRGVAGVVKGRSERT